MRDGAAGVVVDHSARDGAALVSRGASAKFAALDVSYGVRLADGSVPSRSSRWSSIVSVEKDRHGLLAGRRDRQVTFVDDDSNLLRVQICLLASSTHRLSEDNPLAVAIMRIGELDPPPQSANEAHRRIGGTRTVVLAAFKKWCAQGGSGGSGPIGPNHRTTSSEPVRTAELPEQSAGDAPFGRQPAAAYGT